MTLKQELRNALLLYPSIFKNKWSVYHHWFIVNGNGYEWVNGGLVNIENQKEISVEMAINKHFELRVEDNKLLINPIRFSIKMLKQDVLATLDIDYRITDFTPDRKDIYPLCSSAKILNIPNDITPEWTEAINEFYSYLMLNLHTFSEENQKFIKTISLR